MFISTEVQVIVQRMKEHADFRNALIGFGKNSNSLIGHSNWSDHIRMLKYGKFNLVERIYLNHHIAKAQKQATKIELMRIIMGLDSSVSDKNMAYYAATSPIEKMQTAKNTRPYAQ